MTNTKFMTYVKGNSGGGKVYIDVIVPEGAASGSLMTVVNPYTQEQLRVMIPDGVGPGMVFRVPVNQTPTQEVLYQPTPDEDTACLALGSLAALCCCCFLI